MNTTTASSSSPAPTVASQKRQQEQQEHLGICLLQPSLRASSEDPLAATQRIIDLGERARTEHAHTNAATIDLFVLPELCPLGYSEDTFAKWLPTTPAKRAILREVKAELRKAALRWKAAICYGTIGWKKCGRVADNTTASSEGEGNKNGKNGDLEEPPHCEYEYEYEYFIRQSVVDASGDILASYDKIHLCDYGDCSETRFFKAGTSAVAFSLGGWTFGLMICADIRYPLLARALVRDHHADVLLQPACFERSDCGFRTWAPFRETRAVENGVYFVAGNYAGTRFGNAAILPPWIDDDHEPSVLGTDEGYLVAVLDKSTLRAARSDLPFHKHVVSSGAPTTGFE